MAKKKTLKTDKKIISQLQSDDNNLILATIERLRESGNSGYIPILLDLMHSSHNKEVNSKIMKLLSDIKHSDIIPELISAIQNQKYQGERKNLVSICWENGMDFSQNLPVFVDLLINEELEIAIEAYSVITNMTGKIPNKMLDAEMNKIETVLSTVEEQKRQLLIDIIDFIPQLSEQH